MTSRNRVPGFFGEIVFGFCLSLVAAAVAMTLSFVLPTAFVARLVVAGLGLALILRTLARSDESTGRIVTMLVWCVVAAAVWLTGASFPVFVIVQVAMLWLVRSLFSCSSLIEAALDLGLTLLALSFAVFAAVRTDSLFLAAWCFVLVQAFRASIPDFASRLCAGKADAQHGDDPNRTFNDAFRAADEALRRMAGQRP